MSYKLDYHIHSIHSPDSKSRPEDIIKKALDIGLDAIMFTDHCECNNNMPVSPDIKPWPKFNPAEYSKDIEKIREEYGSKLKIGIGVEIGQATQSEEVADKNIAAYDWDFIIGSLHNIKGEYDFYFLDYENIDLHKLFISYFKELYELAVQNKFDVLGHCFYFVRYLYRRGFTVDLNLYKDYVAEIFKLVASNGKGIEINTSCINDKYGDTIPNFEYIKLYKDCGGKVICIGSDAHTVNDLGRGNTLAFLNTSKTQVLIL